MFANVGGEMHTPTWALPIVRKIIAGHAEELVANSFATAENLLGSGRKADIDIIPNAVRTAFFEEHRTPAEARTEIGLPQAGYLIGVPGTLRPMKGHLFFFRAIAPILQGQHDCCVAVTGDGEADYVQSLKTLVHELGISEQVHFIGWVDEMPAFYRSCDFVCIPSRAEPFGRTVIEAFASGTPVVASAVGGIREIIEHGKTGCLIPYGDQRALRQSIKSVLEDEALRKKVSKAARRVAEDKYHETIYKRRVSAVAEKAVFKNS
jgi:glycosyltransferase involved in cell wall biosynthesis